MTASRNERLATISEFKLSYNSDTVFPKAKSGNDPTDKVKYLLKVSCTPFVATLSRQNACHTLYWFHILGLLWSGCGLRRFGWWMDVLISR